jgi:hypothetical protein
MLLKKNYFFHLQHSFYVYKIYTNNNIILTCNISKLIKIKIIIFKLYYKYKYVNYVL